MLKFSWTKIERHVLVKKRASPDDPTLKEYWSKRNKKREISEANKLAAKQKLIAKNQNYKCPVCFQSLYNE